MRCTQYIGLTDAAEDFVSKLEKVDDKEHKTFGMFEEDVPLDTWKLPNGELVREVVQVELWSSGPMIFTCLSVGGTELFLWTKNPSVRGKEYDPKEGTYWV